MTDPWDREYDKPGTGTGTGSTPPATATTTPSSEGKTPLTDQGFISWLAEKVDAGVRGAADVITFGSMDELSAGLASLTGIGGKRGDYEGNLALQRARDAYDKEHSPKTRIAGQVAGGVGAALAVPATIAPRLMATGGPVVRGVLGAAEGAIGGAGYGFGSGEGGFTERVQNMPGEAATGAAGGAAGSAILGPALQAIAARVGPVISRLFQSDPNAALNAARQTLSQATGTPPESITDELARQFMDDARRAVDPAATARQTAANEFNIPLTRGQATGDVGQQAFEEAARNEGRGAQAGTVMRNFDDVQRQRMDEATARLSQTASNLPQPISTRDHLALTEDILGNLRTAAENSRANIRSAYDAADAGGTVVTREGVERAPNSIRSYLDDESLIINPTLTPYADQALRQIDEFAQGRGVLFNRVNPLAEGQDWQGVSLEGVERLRQQLVKMRQNAGPTEQHAMSAVMRSFDRWQDDVAESGLLSGTDEGLELYRQARAARREHGQRFESSPRQADADAGKMIETWTQRDVTPAEVANGLLGVARVGEKGVSVRLARRLETIFGGRDSPEFGAVRQAMIEKLVHDRNGELLSPRMMQQALLRFTTREGREMAGVLFTPQEIGEIRRLAGVVGTLVPDPRATNPSKTSYGVARMLGDFLPRIVGSAVGGAAGGPVGAVAGAVAGAGQARMGGLFSGFRARTATSGAPVRAPAITGVPAGGTAAATVDENPLDLRFDPRR